MARAPGPCGCCKISLEKGAQLFAIFDAVIGILIFLAWLLILVIGDEKKVYLFRSNDVRREVVITLIFFGFFNATTGLFLYFAAGCRSRASCFAWLVVSFPLALVTVNPLKIYESVVVFQFTEEIMKERVKTDLEKDTKAIGGISNSNHSKT